MKKYSVLGIETTLYMVELEAEDEDEAEIRFKEKIEMDEVEPYPIGMMQVSIVKIGPDPKNN